MAVSFRSLLERMTAAICRGEAEAAAGCFVESGVYHDGFYGEFKGRAAIAGMVRRHFHGNARDFSWTLSDVVAEGDCAYASYDFSYVSKMPGSEGRRAGFSGMCKIRLKDGLIERYEEVFERAPVLAQLGFADERILKSVRKWAGA
jgi:ketosteroid isomerase-like protein